MFKMIEKKNNDKGELIDRTAGFTRLRTFGGIIGLDL